MQLQITQEDGLLAFDEATVTPLLEANPLVFHSEFHRMCQQVYSQIKAVPDADASALKDRGFDVLRGFTTTETAAALSAAYGGEIEGQNHAANTKIDPSPALKEQALKLIRSSITVEIEELIEAYLGCFFRIDHIEMMRSRPAEISGKSYEWHRDFDPMAKIHILIYLTDSGPESPTTLFANLADTRRCVEQGYAFPPRSRRVADINSLFPDDADPIVPTRPTLAAGDATIFTPSRILHRGIIHDTEYRDLLVLNILPSMNPWENEIAHLGTERLFIGRSTLWFDPFTRFKPSMAGHNRVQVPLWAQLGYHFPLVPAEE